MTSRECVRRALTFKECGEIPTERDDVTAPDFTYGRGRAGGGSLAGERILPRHGKVCHALLGYEL